jgi:hypothetical protein
MTAVTVPSEISVVLVEPNLMARRQLLISAARALGKNALASLFLRDNLLKSRAFRCGIFRMRVVVIKTGAVRKDQVAFYLLKNEWAVFLDLIVSRFIGVLK